MEKVIYFIFSILILIFGVLILFNISNQNSLNVDKLNTQMEIKSFQTYINQYCSDPFRTNQFVLTHFENFKIYTKENKICSINENDEIYCEKSKCDLLDKTIFDFKHLEFEYNCRIEKNNNLINLSCGN